MKSKITWSTSLICVDYFGAIENSDIERVHFELSGDARFYECDGLILNLIACTLEQVSVPDLINVIATDIGASKTLRNLKVAFVITNQASIAKARDYIEQFRLFKSSWRFKITPSLEDAQQWLQAEALHQ